MKNIFLAGGGSEKDSRKIDEKFVETIDLTKPLVYIPNAAKESKYLSCLAWFKSAMVSLGVENIEMWDSFKPRHPIDKIAGIYLGGGDTWKLLEELRKSGFAEYLIQAIEDSVPVYGGSAGAIILGKDIRTDSSLGNLSPHGVGGLDVVSGYSVACHYRSEHTSQISKLVEVLDCKIVAIPEKSGVYLRGESFSVFGEEPAYIFNGSGITGLRPEPTR